MSVKRYYLDRECIEVLENEWGTLVNYSDYEALAQKCAKYEEALKRIRDFKVSFPRPSQIDSIREIARKAFQHE